MVSTPAPSACVPDQDRDARLPLLFAGLILANCAAWVWAFTLFADRPALLGTALLAWVFGLRHAIDADHIAAIDNVVRKLMQQGEKPRMAGLFFSLGHSTVVIIAAALLALAAAAMKDNLTDFKSIGSVIGTAVSSAFLLVIAIANLLILFGVWKTFRSVSRGGALDNESLDILLSGRGFMARIFRPMFRVVTRSWHMYPLGFLFGLGFDTATEIGLLSISASEAASGMSPLQTLVFPALFTAGMALVDTADSTLMVSAYGWAFVNPIRKLWYNLTITAASVVVALFIGGVEALGLIADQLGLEGGVWGVVASLNDSLANFGFVVIGVFVLAWIVSMLIYKAKDYDRLDVVSPKA
ncbi:HoxN/HupN/NixA family nickel/cobalt transporter [Rhodoblastus sp.]|uniref:HoxN/HupN/NixA family nickel/cobalt transporter n=1 Tax=Rhodoblastus sp. TaxID=1962975 RepID=UPI003F9C4FEC